MRRLFPNAGADEKPGFFLLGLNRPAWHIYMNRPLGINMAK
jgi:hypothetical protein